MTRPLGPTKCSSPFGVPGHRPALAVHHMMVMEAVEREVVDIGPTARFPRDDVVHIGEGHVGAAGKPTVAVTPHHLPALGIRRVAPGPCPRTWCGRRRHRWRRRWWRHTPFAARSRIDQAVPLELAGELGGLDSVVDEGGEWDVHDHEVWAAAGGGALSSTRRRFRSRRRRRADPRASRRPWGPRGPRPPGRAHLGVDRRRELRRHGAMGVVEADEAAIVIRERGNGGVGAATCAKVRATSASSRTVHRSACSFRPSSVSGVATSATTRILSKEISPAHTAPMRWGRSQAFSPPRVSARAVAGRCRSAPWPTVRWRSHPRP